MKDTRFRLVGRWHIDCYYTGTMQRIALVLAMVIAAPTAALADDNFVSLGVGTTANTSDLGGWEGDGVSGSLFVGHRIGYFGLEVGLQRYGLRNDYAASSWSNTSLGAGGSLHLPLLGTFGVFGRLGIEKVWLDKEAGQEYSGTGWYGGLGGELTLDLGFASGAVFLEIIRHGTRFVSDQQARDGSIDMISLGLTVGF